MPDKAREKLALAFAFLRETSSEGLMPLARAFQAELAVRQGDLAAANQWATTIGPSVPFTAMPYFYMPQMTLPKLLLAQDTPSSQKQAADVLARLLAGVISTHNTNFTIEVLALQALSEHVQGHEQNALAALGQAMTLAQSGGYVRGLRRLGAHPRRSAWTAGSIGVAPDYVEQLLAAFAAEHSRRQPSPVKPPNAQIGMIEPLSRREMEVLVLLAQHLTAKEVAQKLFLAEQTVKRHRANIYLKLGVNSLWEAVAAAVALGIIPASS